MGYFGRSAIIELLDLNDALRELIVTPGAGFPAEKSGRSGRDGVSARGGPGEGLFRADHTEGNQSRDICRTGGKPVIIRNYLGLDVTADELAGGVLRRKGRARRMTGGRVLPLKPGTLLPAMREPNITGAAELHRSGPKVLDPLAGAGGPCRSFVAGIQPGGSC